MLFLTLCSLCLISAHAWSNRLDDSSDLNGDEMEVERDFQGVDVEKLGDDIQQADRSNVVVKNEVVHSEEVEGEQAVPTFHPGD